MGLMSGASPFSAPLFARTMADALFLEGGVVLTLGALLEFYYGARSPTPTKKITLPYSLEIYVSGWTLVFSGVLLAMASLAFAFLSMI